MLARLWAQPVVPEIAAGVVAARKTMSVTASSPNSSLAARSGASWVTWARTCAAAARYRYVAGRDRRTLGSSAMPPCLREEPGREQEDRERTPTGSVVPCTWTCITVSRVGDLQVDHRGCTARS